MEKQIYNFLEEKLHSLVGLNSEDIKMDMKLDAPPISISSYDIVQLYAEMEEYFSVRIPDEYLFINKIEDILNSEEELEVPWYGQLMRKTAFLAYLYQIDYWFKTYKIKLEIE